MYKAQRQGHNNPLGQFRFQDHKYCPFVNFLEAFSFNGIIRAVVGQRARLLLTFVKHNQYPKAL